MFHVGGFDPQEMVQLLQGDSEGVNCMPTCLWPAPPTLPLVTMSRPADERSMHSKLSHACCALPAADAGFVDAEACAVAEFQKESYQHPGQQNTFRLLMATAAAPGGG